MESVTVLGVPVVAEDPDRIVEAIISRAKAGGSDGPQYVCPTSVHGIVEADRSPDFARVLGDAWIVTPDGMPLVWMGRLAGAAGMERVYGPDLMKAVCAASVGTGLRHFFYGGAPGVPEHLAARMAEAFPGLAVGGAYSPPFRELTAEELEAVARRINDSGAEIVWVGLSTPKQELWMARVRHLLSAPVLVSVGAAFDFHTGRVRQAPMWMRRRGLEWLFRLSQEPRRLWRRYVFGNSRFAYLALREFLSRQLKTEPRG